MTIRRRVRVALLLMLVVPLFLMGGAYGAVRGFSGGFASGDPFQKRLVAELNRRVNEDPASLEDPRALASLDQRYSHGAGGWTVLKNGRELYRSAGLEPQAAAAFPGRARWRVRTYPSVFPAMSWDFLFPDGSTGTLQIFAGLPWGSPMRGPGWILGFLGVLLVTQGLLGWWVSSAVVYPLARLRDAAIRIGEGDLGFTLARDGPSEFGQVNTAFETMREKLHAAVKRQLAEEASRKELIAHVSHDLRTPINLIRGYAEGIRDGVASTPDMRSRYLDIILERAGELERLIELLFSYSTMDLEGVKPLLGDVDLAAFLEGMRPSLAGMFPAASFSLSPTAGAAPARADTELVRRVMTNLVDNAVKHAGKDAVAVTCTVTRRPESHTVEVSVADDGAGVSAADLPRIFEPFFRADRARTRQGGGGGAGLGLAIVRKLMEAQGGSARAAAAATGGLEVTLSFAEAARGGTGAGTGGGTGT